MTRGRALALGVAAAALAFPSGSVGAPAQPALVVEAPDGTSYAPRLARSMSGGGAWMQFDGDAGPVVRAAAGAPLVFRFSFQPTEVLLTYAGTTLPLAPAPTVAWQVPDSGEHQVDVEVAGQDETSSFRFGYVFRVTTGTTAPGSSSGRIKPYISTRRGVSLLASRRIVRLCRGETVSVVLGYELLRVRGRGFGGGRLKVVEGASGTFAWTLRARRGGQARLTAWPADGGRRTHAFRYSVRRC